MVFLGKVENNNFNEHYNVTLALVYTTKVSLLLTCTPRSSFKSLITKGSIAGLFPTFFPSFPSVVLAMSTLTLVYSNWQIVWKLNNSPYCKAIMLYALIKYLFLRPLVNYFGQKTFGKRATSRLLWCEAIRRSDWLLAYLTRIFKFISFFNKIVKLFSTLAFLLFYKRNIKWKS